MHKLKLTLTLVTLAALGGAAVYFLEKHDALGHGHADHKDHGDHDDHDDHDGHAKDAPKNPDAGHAHPDGDSPPMQTTIGEKSARMAGMKVEQAGPATFTETIPVYGQIKLNADKIARATPRFGGIVREARKVLGDPVKAGETVAILETNQTLATIEVKAPINGAIIERNVAAGETVAEGAALYTIADLSDVWAELDVPGRDRARVRTGQAVTLHATDGGPPAQAVIAWISPFGRPDAQTITVRVVLPNADSRWHPGLHVSADITVAEFPVPVAVKESGVQTLNASAVVFSRHGELYKARPLELGRRSGGRVEVLKGIDAGESYVVENSFLVKADIGKSGAAHEH